MNIREKIRKLEAELAQLKEEAQFADFEKHKYHRKIFQHEESKTFHAREGCLDCNVWLEPVRCK